MRAVILSTVAMLFGCGGGAPPSRPPPPSATPPSVAPAAKLAPEREDFEAATAGSPPPGWKVAGMAKEVSFAAARADAGMVLEVVTAADGFGSIKRPLDVARYRGKRVAIAVRGSCEPSNRRAFGRVGVDVSRPGVRGYGDRARTDRIDTPAWREYQAIVDVASDATALDLVIAVVGASTIRIDDIALTVLGDAGAGDEPPRALEGRALDNVVAFARLYGIVRYFHPSDEAAALDTAAWERFVVRGVRAVESAPDAAALATRLAPLFAPIAPSVAIYTDARTEPAPAVARPAVHWMHSGIGISKDNIYRSTRGDGTSHTYTTITTPIAAGLVRGKEIKVTLRAHAELAGSGADVGLWIYETKGDGNRGFYTEPEMQPAVGTAWTDVTVSARISSDARDLLLGVQAIDDSEVWFEVPVVTVDGKPLALPGWGTPGAELAPAWTSGGSDFDIAVGDKGCAPRRTCLHMRRKPTPPPDLRPWTGALGGGVAASVPLELSTRDGKTVPAATAALPAFDARPLLAGDRATRLAAVIIAWNVFEHFYPYFDVRGTDWMPELPRRLREAALDDGPAALHGTLRGLVHELHDGHGNVSHPGEDRGGIAPWLWERVEGKLVITQVSEQCACDLAPGDVVTAIDGVPAERAWADAGAQLSAATEQFRNYVIGWRSLLGPEGSLRRLTIERNGAAHEVEVALVEGASLVVEKRPTSGDEIAPGIRYVDVDTVTPEQWKKILPDLAAARAVVVDMRGYPNKIPLTEPLAHATRTRLRSARWNVPVVVRPDREAMTFSVSDWTIEPAEPFLANVVFITDGRAVSAAETFMGIVEHYKLGPIVGGPTAGTNGNVNPFSVPGGYQLSWTGMKVLKHDGSRHHGVGIQPTVPATRTLAGVAAQRDELLEKAIEVARRPHKPAARNARRRE